MNIIEASAILQISTKYTFAELLSAYRRQAALRHPDRGGSDAQFQELTEAFNFMKPLAGQGFSQELAQKPRTYTGELLSTLGKGFPLNKNACTCENCSGQGYTSQTISRNASIRCPKCQGHGIISYPCKKCGATGKLNGRTCPLCKGTKLSFPRMTNEEIDQGWSTTKNGKRVLIEASRKDAHIFGKVCYNCEGEGRIPYMAPLFFFSRIIPGHKYVEELMKMAKCSEQRAKEILDYQGDDEETKYSLCHICRGVGEVEMFNPVLPRGLFQASK